MKCALHFSNGVFNSLAPVKRGDNVDQLRKTEWMEESERRRRAEEEEESAKVCVRRTALFGFGCQEKHQLLFSFF